MEDVAPRAVNTPRARAPRAHRFTRRPLGLRVAAAVAVGTAAIVLVAALGGGTAQASVTAAVPRVSPSFDPFRPTRPMAQAEPAPPETPVKPAPKDDGRSRGNGTTTGTTTAPTN